MRNRTKTLKTLEFGPANHLKIQKVTHKHGSIYNVRKHFQKYVKYAANSIPRNHTGFHPIDAEPTIETLGTFKTLQDAEHFFLHCTLSGVMENE